MLARSRRAAAFARVLCACMCAAASASGEGDAADAAAAPDAGACQGQGTRRATRGAVSLGAFGVPDFDLHGAAPPARMHARRRVSHAPSRSARPALCRIRPPGRVWMCAVETIATEPPYYCVTFRGRDGDKGLGAEVREQQREQKGEERRRKGARVVSLLKMSVLCGGGKEGGKREEGKRKEGGRREEGARKERAKREQRGVAFPLKMSVLYGRGVSTTSGATSYYYRMCSLTIECVLLRCVERE